MKKIKMSVAALSLAMSINAQTTVDYQRVTTPHDEVTFTRYEVIEMLHTIGDILEWQNQDIEDAEYNGKDPDCGRYSEGWGSNYWLTILEEELYAKLQHDHYVPCENCDEID